MRVCGVDPGMTGALAFLDHGNLKDLWDMPVFDGRVDGGRVADLLTAWKPSIVCLEWTQPMPKNGVIASFSLGQNTGIVMGVAQALRYPLVRVRPARWKKDSGLWRKPKAASRGLASDLYPEWREQFRLVKNDGRAEAVLIARWCLSQQIKERNDDTRVDGEGVVVRDHHLHAVE